jgi:glycosyltransferase involved in cell wall biosynthesis
MLSMQTSKNINLCLFFTYPMSLKQWDETGMFDREVSLYKKLSKHGVNITFFTYGDDTEYRYIKKLPGINIVPAFGGRKLPTSKLWGLFLSLLLPFKNRKLFAQFDILKSNQMLGAWVPLVTKFVTGKKFLVRCGYELHEGMVEENRPLWKRMIVYGLSLLTYHGGNHVILTSDHMAETVESDFKVCRKKISVFPNFIDTDLFKPTEHIVASQNRVLIVGRLHIQKNLKNLIKACKQANIGLDIVGEGDMKEELEKLTKEISADVNFLGRLPNSALPVLINQYPIFILPSIWEGNPKGLLEAMSCGRAVIGTNVVGTRDIIQHEVNGLLCDGTVESLSSTLLRLTGDHALQKRLGKEARSYILQKCSLDTIVRRERKFYDKLMKKAS